MKKEEIISICKKTRNSFLNVIKNVRYEKRGILNSELLLIVALIEHLKISQIIESGRARGHSTYVLCKYFEGKDINITSIDFDKSSDDAKYAEGRLKKYKNLNLAYGDSNTLIHKIINQDCAVIIDGPKGEEALMLALNLLKNNKVRVLFIHDLHRNTFDRNLSEILFKSSIYSDDIDYVESFRDIDDPCWEILKDEGEAPYTRKNQKIDSYSSTVEVIFNNNPIDNIIEENYVKYYQEKNRITFNKYIRSVLKKNKVIHKALSKLYHSINRN